MIKSLLNITWIRTKKVVSFFDELDQPMNFCVAANFMVNDILIVVDQFYDKVKLNPFQLRNVSVSVNKIWENQSHCFQRKTNGLIDRSNEIISRYDLRWETNWSRINGWFGSDCFLLKMKRNNSRPHSHRGAEKLRQINSKFFSYWHGQEIWDFSWSPKNVRTS